MNSLDPLNKKKNAYGARSQEPRSNSKSLLLWGKPLFPSALCSMKTDFFWENPDFLLYALIPFHRKEINDLLVSLTELSMRHSAPSSMGSACLQRILVCLKPQYHQRSTVP